MKNYKRNKIEGFHITKPMLEKDYPGRSMSFKI